MKLKLNQIAGLLSTRGREPSTCEACGGPFSCGAKLSGCWCSEIKLSDETRAELKSRYRNCLCRECLERVANSETVEAYPVRDSAAEPMRKGSALPGTKLN